MEIKNTISTRINNDQKIIIEKAANILGLSVCAFIRTQSLSKANKILKESESGN